MLGLGLQTWSHRCPTSVHAELATAFVTVCSDPLRPDIDVIPPPCKYTLLRTCAIEHDGSQATPPSKHYSWREIPGEPKATSSVGLPWPYTPDIAGLSDLNCHCMSGTALRRQEALGVGSPLLPDGRRTTVQLTTGLTAEETMFWPSAQADSQPPRPVPQTRRQAPTVYTRPLGLRPSRKPGPIQSNFQEDRTTGYPEAEPTRTPNLHATSSDTDEGLTNNPCRVFTLATHTVAPTGRVGFSVFRRDRRERNPHRHSEAALYTSPVLLRHGVMNLVHTLHDDVSIRSSSSSRSASTLFSPVRHGLRQPAVLTVTATFALGPYLLPLPSPSRLQKMT